MYTIYTSPGTGAFAAEAMLEAGKAPWKRELVDTEKDEHRSAGYLAINPAAQIPALILPDGQLMTESAAICLFLGDAHKETKLAPQPDDPGRAAYLRWMVYLSASVYEADLRCYYSDRYTSDAKGADAVKSRAIEQMNASFAIIDEHLSRHEWLADQAMSAADIYLAMLASWHPDIPSLKHACPRVAGVWEKVAKIDFVKKANTFHKLW
jgi:glutathione S-transferase